MIFDSEVPVLVNEDAVLEHYRIDHAARILMLQRPQKSAATSMPFPMMPTPRPSPWLYEDHFVGVYPVIEAFQQASIAKPGQPLFALTHVPNRLDEPNPEDFAHRIDLTQLYRFRVSLSATTQMQGFLEEIPDLNDNPWLEWVHPGRDHPNTLQPFRQYLQPPPPPLWPLFAHQSPNFRVEAEIDTEDRQFDASDVQMLYRHSYLLGPFPAVALECFEADIYTAILAWSASAGAAGYRLYINGVPQTAVLNTQAATVGNLQLNTAYTFAVVAVNAIGNDASSLSNVINWSRSSAEIVNVQPLPWDDAGTIPEGEP